EDITGLRRGTGDNKQLMPEGAPAGPQQEQILHRRETAELLRAWYSVTDPKQRRKILDLIKSMGKTDKVEG
nr:hypothetical protein [Pseudomonadota bacterium]